MAARAVAQRLDLPLETLVVSIGDGASLEGRARVARLAALEEFAAVDEWIVTGHQADDAAETVLGNVLRGAGATGLAGISRQRGQWVRPLLGIASADVRRCAEQLGLPFRDDPENANPRHRRNVLRHDVIPYLEQRLGVDVQSATRRLAAAAAADDAALFDLAATIPIGKDSGAVIIAAPALGAAPAAVRARAVRAALRMIHPPYAGSASDVEAVLVVAADGTARMAGGAVHISLEGPHLALYVDRPVTPKPVMLAIPGCIEFGSHRVTADMPTPRRPVRIGRNHLVLVADRVTDEAVTVRASTQGERIPIAGGTKLVRDAMAESGVPRRLRPAWPVVEVDGNMVWVPGVRVADRWKPTGATYTVLRWEREVRWTSQRS